MKVHVQLISGMNEELLELSRECFVLCEMMQAIRRPHVLLGLTGRSHLFCFDCR